MISHLIQQPLVIDKVLDKVQILLVQPRSPGGILARAVVNVMSKRYEHV
jgi:hypothetical protein